MASEVTYGLRFELSNLDFVASTYTNSISHRIEEGHEDRVIFYYSSLVSIHNITMVPVPEMQVEVGRKEDNNHYVNNQRCVNHSLSMPIPIPTELVLVAGPLLYLSSLSVSSSTASHRLVITMYPAHFYI